MKELSKKETISYSFLGFVKTIYDQITAFYLLFFYTDILTIPAQAVVVLFLISHIWDAVNDQASGYFMCKTQSKGGSSRPYIKWTAIPLGLLSVAMFITPSESITVKIVYAYILYFIWDSVNTLMSIATTSLLPQMCKSEQERTRLNSFLIIASVIGVLIVSSCTLPIANWLGGGDFAMSVKGNSQRGFPLAVLLYSLMLVPMQLIAFKNCKERYVAKNERPISLKASMKSLIKDRGLMLFFFIFILTTMANTFKNQSSTYYITYVLQRPEMVSVFFFLGVGASLAMQAFVPMLMKRINISWAMLFGMSISVVGLIVMLLAQKNLTITIAGNMLFGVASAIPANLVFVILASFIDKFNNKYKQNLNSWLYATLNFGSKLGAAIGGAIISAVLAYVGYKPNMQPTAQLNDAITFNFIWGTIIAYTLACVLMFALIKQSKQKRILQRKYSLTSDVAGSFW